MPTYEYACSSCGNQWEEIQKISEAPIQECPKCHEQTARRQISGGRFILKGGGWYADLYSSVKPGKKDDSKSSPSSSSATDAKPAGDGGSKDTGSKDSGASSSASTTPAASGSGS